MMLVNISPSYRRHRPTHHINEASCNRGWSCGPNSSSSWQAWPNSLCTWRVFHHCEFACGPRSESKRILQGQRSQLSGGLCIPATHTRESLSSPPLKKRCLRGPTSPASSGRSAGCDFMSGAPLAVLLNAASSEEDKYQCCSEEATLSQSIRQTWQLQKQLAIWRDWLLSVCYTWLQPKNARPARNTQAQSQR